MLIIFFLMLIRRAGQLKGDHSSLCPLPAEYACSAYPRRQIHPKSHKHQCNFVTASSVKCKYTDLYIIFSKQSIQKYYK